MNKNMKTLGIMGNPERGEEIINLLQTIFKIDADNSWLKGNDPNTVYYPIVDGGVGLSCLKMDTFRKLDIDNISIFTIEQFDFMFPFRIGESVCVKNGVVDVINDMIWDGEKILYKTSKYDETYSIDYLIGLAVKDKEEDEDVVVDATEMEDEKNGRIRYNIPDGYEFEHFEAGAIVLKRKKNEYPKDFKECCKALFGDESYMEFTFVPAKVCKSLYRGDFITELPSDILPYETEIRRLYNLLVCRNAYWKIAGEEMGLDEPWKPDWKSGEQKKHCIYYGAGIIQKGAWCNYNSILAFPTIEMRDVFYENFKDLIESCKELL